MEKTSYPGYEGYQSIKVQLLDHFRGDLPEYKTADSSGFDVRAQLDQTVILEVKQRALIPTGLCFEVPRGFELQARPRSGWAIKKGITLLNTPGTIDADYRGEVQIILINLGAESVQIEDQDRIAQLVLTPVVQARFEICKELSTTDRGQGGFGSTGI